MSVSLICYYYCPCDWLTESNVVLGLGLWLSLRTNWQSLVLALALNIWSLVLGLDLRESVSWSLVFALSLFLGPGLGLEYLVLGFQPFHTN